MRCARRGTVYRPRPFVSAAAGGATAGLVGMSRFGNGVSIHRHSSWYFQPRNPVCYTSSKDICSEVTSRGTPAPSGVGVIRAEAVRRGDLGDGASVQYMDLALTHGIEASRWVLGTADDSLLARRSAGVLARNP